MVKGQGKTSGLCILAVRSIYFYSFAWKSPNSVQLIPLRVLPYWCLCHMVKGQIVGLNPKCCLLNILLVKLWIQVYLTCFAFKPSKIRLSLASNLSNHQFENFISYSYATLLNFCISGAFMFLKHFLGLFSYMTSSTKLTFNFAWIHTITCYIFLKMRMNIISYLQFIWINALLSHSLQL